MLSPSVFVTATSPMPSPFTSPIARRLGILPVANGEPAIRLNPPLPSPSRRVKPSLPRRSAVLLGELTIARSGPAVPVEVPDGGEERRIPARKGGAGRGLESPLAIAEQDRHVVAFEIGGDDVIFTIAVEVRDPHPLVGMLPDRQERPGLETASAVAEQNRHLIVPPTVRQQVQVSVAVEVARRHAMSVRAHRHSEWRARRGRESTSAVPQQHGQVLRFMIREGQIRPAVPVEIADGDVVGLLPGGKGRALRRREPSPAVAEQDGHVLALLVGDCEVGFAVTIEISHLDASGRAPRGKAGWTRRGPGPSPGKSRLQRRQATETVAAKISLRMTSPSPAGSRGRRIAGPRPRILPKP